MTRQEIQALIDAKIKGQGTAVDAGSVLPAILTGILDLIEQGGGGGTADAVQYIPQELTSPQQMQARKNQGLYYSEETPAGVITWDGDTTGKEVIEGDYIFCKVTTDVPPMESVKTVGYIMDGEESIFDIEDTTSIDGGYVIEDVIIVITESEATIQGSSLSKGVWFKTEGNRFVSKLTYDAYETIHKIPQKYLPSEGLQTYDIDVEWSKLDEIITGGYGYISWGSSNPETAYEEVCQALADGKMIALNIGQGSYGFPGGKLLSGNFVPLNKENEDGDFASIVFKVYWPIYLQNTGIINGYREYLIRLVFHEGIESEDWMVWVKAEAVTDEEA